MGLLARNSPFNINVEPYGDITLLPVQVSNLKGRKFDSRILFNAYPRFEIYTVQNSFLPFVYDERGNELNVSRKFQSYNTQIHEHIVRNIIVSPDLKNYDILLCSKTVCDVDLIQMA
jgi:hypothetical protein